VDVPKIRMNLLLATNDTDLHESFFTRTNKAFNLVDHCRSRMRGFFCFTCGFKDVPRAEEK
jgi:hypothetical protein